VEFRPLQPLFRTTTLDWSMHFVCWAFAAGSLLASYGAKKIFDKEKVYEQLFKMNFNESGDEGEQNVILSMTSRFKSTLIRQETVMELESCNSDKEE
jgi:hypothetical protein